MRGLNRRKSLNLRYECTTVYPEIQEKNYHLLRVWIVSLNNVDNGLIWLIPMTAKFFFLFYIERLIAYFMFRAVSTIDFVFVVIHHSRFCAGFSSFCDAQHTLQINVSY